MNVTMKTCPGYGEQGPHTLIANKANFHRNVAAKDGFQSKCQECERQRAREMRAAGTCDGTPREDQMQGVYLAAMKLADGEMILKIGESAMMRTRAGNMASDARKKHGLDIEWAEIMYVIEVDDEDGEKSERLKLEREVLAEATPIYGDEFFAGIDFDKFTTLVWMGRPYTERTTSYDRRHQFFQWLANMDGLEMSPKPGD